MRGVSLRIFPGEALGLVGESGSGKTTLGRTVIRLVKPTGGVLLHNGRDITTEPNRRLAWLRRETQMVFQDPRDSLNPRWRVQEAIEEPLRLQTALTKGERWARVEELLHLVSLDESFRQRYPHELSGGQQQRVGIARALATNPGLLVLDEPTSALDWLTRFGILELFAELRSKLNLTYLFISHDLSSVRTVCDRIAVMYLGQIVEEASTETLFKRPTHPYTRVLLSSILDSGVSSRRERVQFVGEPASPINPPNGCALHPRCPISVAECAVTDQNLCDIGENHLVACMRMSGDEDVVWPASSEGSRARKSLDQER